jgi:hypothetical protein
MPTHRSKETNDAGESCIEVMICKKKKKVWTCAKAKCIPLYNKKRANMKMLKKEAALDMLKTDPKHYCIAWFKTYTKCDFVDYCRELQ